jgi:signal transduction histidine kinase
MDECNLDDAERLAHTLKSVAAILGAADLTEASTQLEAALHARHTKRSTALLEILEKALDPAIAAVNSLTVLPDGELFDDGQSFSKRQTPKRFPCILLIDDDPATVAVLNDAFQSGYDVLVATDGLAGLESAAVREPDVILLDVSMADVDGFEVCRRLKADPTIASVPIIFITGVSRLDAELEGLKLGAADYLVKPLNTESLKARVDNHIALKWAKDKLTLRAAEEVAASYERFHAVLESTSDNIMIMDREWRVLYANGRALKTLPDLRIGENYWSCFPALLGTPAERFQRNTMTNRSEEQYQLFYPPYERWYHVKAFPVNDGISVFFSDITDAKKLDDQIALEQLLREKRIEALSHMAGSLAHEISNPLAIIHGRASELIRKAEMDEPIAAIDVRRACDSIVKTSDRAVKILRGLKGFAREGAQDPLQLGSIYQIIDQCVEMQANRLERHLIAARLQVAEGIPDFMCREVQIEQILTNLLNNAFDAIVHSDSRERWISLTALYSGGQICIDVTDSGPGIEDHYREHLMEPFFTTKGMGLGMGVGLSLSRVIAEDHGGTLTLRIGTKNTTFRLVLPIGTESTNEFINPTNAVTY